MSTTRRRSSRLAPPATTTLAAIEHEHILRALRASNWVIGGAGGAADHLGLPHTTLHHKLRKLGIIRPARDGHWSPDRMRSASPLAS